MITSPEAVGKLLCERRYPSGITPMEPITAAFIFSLVQ